MNCVIPDNNERKELNMLLRQTHSILNKNGMAEAIKEVSQIMSKLNKIYAQSNQLLIQFDEL